MTSEFNSPADVPLWPWLPNLMFQLDAVVYRVGDALPPLQLVLCTSDWPSHYMAAGWSTTETPGSGEDPWLRVQRRRDELIAAQALRRDWERARCWLPLNDSTLSWTANAAPDSTSNELARAYADALRAHPLPLELALAAARNSNTTPGHPALKPVEYVPFLSPSVTRASWDVPIPHFEVATYGGDLARVAAWRFDQFRSGNWSRRTPTAAFHGTSYCEAWTTGICGNCSRLSAACVADLAGRRAHDESAGSPAVRVPALDIHIGSLDRICPDSHTWLAAAGCAVRESEVVPLDRLIEDRAVIHLEGHTYSSRRAKLFTFGATILQQRMQHEEFFDLLVEEGRHVAGFDCKDVASCASLLAAAEWAQREPDAAFAMAVRAWNEVTVAEFGSSDGWMCYWAQLLTLMAGNGLMPPAPSDNATVADLVARGEWVPIRAKYRWDVGLR